jgi:chromate reductase, NAD(P)H dehydrogenase (quinone)
MELLGVVGSLRADSYNAQLMNAAAGVLPADADLSVFDGLRDIPPYEDGIDEPDAVQAFKEAIRDADGILFATPEYNGSIPGQLKNALDWASRPFEHNVLRNKPVAVMGTSTGMFGAVWAQAELRKVLGLIGARVLDRDTPVPLAESSFIEGRLDPELLENVTATVHDLGAMVHARGGAEAARPFNRPPEAGAPVRISV